MMMTNDFIYIYNARCYKAKIIKHAKIQSRRGYLHKRKGTTQFVCADLE